MGVEQIENLGATKDRFDCIDLTENEIGRLENFPKLYRLATLMLANNRIARIADGFGLMVPNLAALNMSGNRLSTLSDLLPLARLKKVSMLSLLSNAVTKRPNYRAFVINMLPSL